MPTLHREALHLLQTKLQDRQTQNLCSDLVCRIAAAKHIHHGNEAGRKPYTSHNAAARAKQVKCLQGTGVCMCINVASRMRSCARVNLKLLCMSLLHIQDCLTNTGQLQNCFFE